ncbi:glycyl-tRNA synthetase [Cyclobacterium lianum]|uniref:Glycine--tRNA ligase n=1 Tax=Cyclobacterium lianum TaxID=388280 RepID=A0A1M7IM26_9BACT|nr:glycine--tRNA ligase [Cyclobacterium lianum]SHM41695.1 glycyl-tRNA synthetase [Cyclobacterium lianum]
MAKSAQPQESNLLKDIIAHAKEYGFVYPSSEIYDGLQAVYDYGPYGVELKNNLKRLWWESMTRLNDNIVGLDAAIFMHPTTWKASGHVDSFNDPMVDNKDSKKRYRADVLIEEKAAQYEQSGEVEKGKELLAAMGKLLDAEDFAALRDLMINEGITCPLSGTVNWTEIRQFNLMFSTQVGSVSEDSSTIYLRPETAQGIFVNFLNVQKTARMKVPFGIAQIGKAFRNEIVARQFIFRMREFEQMEMQYFVRPGTELEWYQRWADTRVKWHLALGIPEEKIRRHDHDKLAHYANAALDIEYQFPFGFKEVEGIHSRTDFDLKAHQDYSKKKQQYFDPEVNQNYVPYVIETSIGADRLFLMALCNAYVEEKSEDKIRTYLKFHPALAPVKAAILPLTKKDGLPEKGKEIFEQLKYDFNIIYEEAASIGKRYARQDLIGTPFCIAVDHQTLEDDTVTIRHRDSMVQERVAIAQLHGRLAAACSFKTVFEKI